MTTGWSDDVHQCARPVAGAVGLMFRARPGLVSRAMADPDTALPPDLAARLSAMGRVVRFGPGDVVFGPGRAPRGMVVLRRGSLRVRQVGEGGHEIVLYRIGAGASCVMTSACMLAQEQLAAEGVAETSVEALVIARAEFDRLMGETAFRDAVLRAFSARIVELMGVLEAVAFGRLDIRLAQLLLRLAGEGETVRATHAELAVELGSAREVISRQLAEFRRRGWVEATRGEIVMRDRAVSRGLAAA
jgi:CRP/FNR family transcriptional regulator